MTNSQDLRAARLHHVLVGIGATGLISGLLSVVVLFLEFRVLPVEASRLSGDLILTLVVAGAIALLLAWAYSPADTRVRFKRRKSVLMALLPSMVFATQAWIVAGQTLNEEAMPDHRYYEGLMAQMLRYTVVDPAFIAACVDVRWGMTCKRRVSTRAPQSFTIRTRGHWPRPAACDIWPCRDTLAGGRLFLRPFGPKGGPSKTSR